MSAVKDSEGPVFAGIDIGGTSIKWMIVDEAGAILTQGNAPTNREAVAEQVGRIGARLASDYPGLVGFGLICPGLVDEEKGTVVYAANLELRGVQLARAVEEATGVPAALMHDGRAAALDACRILRRKEISLHDRHAQITRELLQRPLKERRLARARRAEQIQRIDPMLRKERRVLRRRRIVAPQNVRFYNYFHRF